MRQWRTAAVLVGLLLAWGCKPKVSDTGYVGTWSRDIGANRVSTISIAPQEEGYRFAWKVTTPDGKWRTQCDGEGRCEEFVDGAKVADYRFTTRVDPATKRLLVECHGKVHKPKELDIHYLDELVVEPGGLVLWSYTMERAGQRFEGEARPKHRFEKVSDEVAAR